MGVHGLWRLLESTGKPINPETLEGKILAVDISIWLNQAVKGVRDRDGNSVQNAHLLTLFHRICKLLFFRIKPVFVFDGEAPLLKKQTLALRRQRKEELSRESKQTNEKLLRTFLKRQAIKAALGDRSKDPLPSLSTVRRDEVDDMYVLPALPAEEDKDKSSSSEQEEEEEEREAEEMADIYHSYQGEMYENPNSVDINSEEFACLPPEMKHEILKDMKEFSKRRRTMYHKPPEGSGDFSQYQLAGLLQRNKLNQRLEGVEKEMSQRSAVSAPQLYEQDGEQHSHSVESQRLVSEDHSHYILVKGSKKPESVPESQPAPSPWSGGFLSGSKRRAADRPEPLWRPICEDEEPVWGHSSEDSKPTLSKTAEEETSPPSPRTLEAIQAAMNESSDEEKVDLDKQGSLSPRTLLAIQQALTEEDNPAASAATQQAKRHYSSSQVIISSSEEEPDKDDLKSKAEEKSDLKNVTGIRAEPDLYVKDSLLVSSSDDEMEEMICQRNKALRIAALQQPQGGETKPEQEMKKEQLTNELQRKESEQGSIRKNGELVPPQVVLSSNASAQMCEKPLSPEAEVQPVEVELQGNHLTGALEEQEKKRRVDVKPSGIEESESEESFIEVSEDEFKEEEEEESPVLIRETESSDEVCKDETMKEESAAESLPEATSGLAAASEEEGQEEEDEDKKNQAEEKEANEHKETPSSSAAAINEWDDIDVGELEALDSSLQMEQSNLKELKQQQERMANTVTGQMYLESQELLRLFGVPFLVAPMEAEAQCAALDRGDQTHGTITDDSDVWLFGGRHVYRNFFSQNKYVEHYQYSDLQSQLGLDRTKLINLAYLLGSDYTEGVPGVGYVTGMEILNEFPGTGLQPLTLLSQWWIEAQEKKRLVADPRETKVKKKLRDLKLHPGFPNPAVAQAYLEPAVFLNLSFTFCLSRFGWTSRRTEETLQPVIKQLNTQQTQLRIDSFFRMEQQEKQAIRSQRLRRAVTCMKRKEREGGEGEEEDSEEEMVSPSKAKKGKAANKSLKDGGGEEREGDRSVVVGGGGGFLGSEVISDSPRTPPKAVSNTSQEPPSKTPEATKTLPQKTRKSCSGSSSSGSDDNSDDGHEVTMVTARSVFEGSHRGRGGKNKRGRGGIHADMEAQQSEALEVSNTKEGAAVDAELAKAIMAKHFLPSLIGAAAWEGYMFSGQEIRIKESTDLYGAVLWPSAMVLCHFLESNQGKFNLTDKNVIELGAGTGLVTIVSSLLGAKVTSTDLPDVLGNLQYNVMRNTKDRCKYIPLVTELIWGQEVEQRFPRATHCFDYILAADVVYAHPYLDELMDTFDYLCQENTQILWAMRFRLDPENSFVDRFRQRFHVELLYDLPSLSIKLYRAWREDGRTKDQREAAA
ncbi:uncharacterized protein V6R79_001930 [Siganus canaliculatus]